VDTVFAIVQILLGLAFVAVGPMHFRLTAGATPPKGMEWVQVVPTTGLRVIAVLELLGGVALLGTLVTGMTSLAALAAGCVALLMLFAVIFHARRPGERPNIVLNVILGVLALVVLYGNLT
jgi:hypothetical protein